MLHIFDLDGTLIPGSTASLEIAKVTGTTSELLALEARFSRGEIGTRQFAHTIGQLWRGLSADTVEKAMQHTPFLHGIDEVLSDIRTRGERSALITMSPTFFADRMSIFGFDHIAGSVFPSLPLTEDPTPEHILVPESKVSITETLLGHYGLEWSDCVAYGDSLSDLPLFAKLDHTVAINASAQLRALSRHHYSGDSLWEAYSHAHERGRPSPTHVVTHSHTAPQADTVPKSHPVPQLRKRQ